MTAESPPHDRTCDCAECLEREEAAFRAWQQTREGLLTCDYVARRAANGFLPRDPNPELDALIANMKAGG